MKEKILPKLEGAREHDLLVQRYAECEAADKLVSGNIMTMGSRDLTNLLTVLDGTNITFPFPVRCKLVERHATDVCKDIFESTEDPVSLRSRFCELLLPQRGIPASFDCFCLTLAGLLVQELEQVDEAENLAHFTDGDNVSAEKYVLDAEDRYPMYPKHFLGL